MATRTMEFQVPKIVHEEVDEQRGIFVIEPLDRGFGFTFGNSLRRVLLSSLEGAAVTSVKIEGVAHEFTTLPGVREDVTDIILNLKSLICRLHGESPEVEVRLQKKGPGTVTAADIQAPAELEILNPELEEGGRRGEGGRGEGREGGRGGERGRRAGAQKGSERKARRSRGHSGEERARAAQRGERKRSAIERRPKILRDRDSAWNGSRTGSGPVAM